MPGPLFLYDGPHGWMGVVAQVRHLSGGSGVEMAPGAKAIVIHETDNVATALTSMAAGAKVRVVVQGLAESITLVSSIPMGHKFALRDILKGTPVIKYGEPIGEAVKDIRRGEHVHVHNVVSRTG